MAEKIITGLQLTGDAANLLSSLKTTLASIRQINKELDQLKRNASVRINVTVGGTGGPSGINNIRQFVNGLGNAGRAAQRAASNIGNAANATRQAASALGAAARQARGLAGPLNANVRQTQQIAANATAAANQTRNLNRLLGSSAGGRTFGQKFLTSLGIVGGGAGIFAVIRELREGIKGLIEDAGEFQRLSTSFVSILAQAQQNATGNKPITSAELSAIRGESVRLFRDAQIAAIQTVATTKEYVEVLQAALAVGQQIGLSQEQTEKITKRLVLAAGAFGVEQSSVATSVSQILAGTVRVTNQLGRSLGLTTKEQREQLKLAIQQGRLFEFLDQKTRAFGDTAKEVADNFINVRAAIADIFEVGGAEAIQPLFKFLNDELIKFRDKFISQNPLQIFRPALREIIAETQKFFRAIVPNLRNVFTEFKGLVSSIGKSITGESGISGTKTLLNTFAAILRLVRDIVSSRGLGQVIIIVTGASLVLRGISSTLRGIVVQSAAFAENMRRAALAGGAAAGTIRTATFAGITSKALGALGLVIAAISVLWDVFSNNTEDAAKAVENVSRQFDKLDEQVNKFSESAGFRQLLADFEAISKTPVDQRSEDQLKRLAEITTELDEAFQKLGLTFDESSQKILASGRITSDILAVLLERSDSLDKQLSEQIAKTEKFISLLEQLRAIGVDRSPLEFLTIAQTGVGINDQERAELIEQIQLQGQELQIETGEIIKNNDALTEAIQRQKSLNAIRQSSREQIERERRSLSDTLDQSARQLELLRELREEERAGIVDDQRRAEVAEQIRDLEQKQATALSDVVEAAKLKGRITGQTSEQVLKAQKAELEAILTLNTAQATNIALARQSLQTKLEQVEKERNFALALGDVTTALVKQNEALQIRAALSGTTPEQLKKDIEDRVAIINRALANVRVGASSAGTGKKGGAGRQRDELRDFLQEIDRQRALLNAASDLIEKDVDRIEEQKRRAIRELGQAGALPFEDALEREGALIRRANTIRQSLNDAQRNFIKSNNELIKAVADRQQANDKGRDKKGIDLRDRRIEVLERENKQNLEILKKITDDARKFEDQLTELTRFGVEQRIDLRRREVEFQREFARLQADSTNRVKQAQAQLGILSTEAGIQAEFEAGKADRDARRKALLFELAPLADPQFVADLKAANEKFGTTATGETIFEIIDRQSEEGLAALEEDVRRAEDVAIRLKTLNDLISTPVKTRTKADTDELVRRRDELEQKLRELNESIASRAGGTLTTQQIQAATTVITLLTNLGIARQEQIAKLAELLGIKNEEAAALIDKNTKLHELELARLDVQRSIVEFDTQRLDLLEQIVERQREFGQISDLDARRAQLSILQKRIELQELLRQKLQQDLQTRFANVTPQSNPTQFAQQLEVASQINEVNARLFDLKNRAFELRSPLAAAAQGFRTVAEAVGAIEGPIGSLRNVFSGLASLSDALANRQRPRTAGEDIREAAKAVEGSGTKFKDIVGEASVLWKNAVNQTAEVLGGAAELFRKLINDFKSSGASGGGELPLSGLSAGSLLGSLGFDPAPTPAAANDLKKTGDDLKTKISSLIGNIATSTVDLLQSITSGDIGSIVSSVGRTIGTFGGPIGKAIGSVVEIAGGVISFFGARARQKTKEMAEAIDKGISDLKEKISSGAIGLGEGIAQLRAELENARRRLSNRKGGREELSRIEEETQAEIERLKQQARDIQKNFRDQLDLLRTPTELRDIKRQIREIAADAREFVKSFENSNDALAAIEEAQEFVRRSIQELKDEVEKSLKGLQDDLKQATDDFTQSRRDILLRGRVSPQVSEAEQKRRDLIELEKNFRRQRQELQDQIAGEQKKLDFVNDRFKIEEKIAKLINKSASQLGLAADRLSNVSLQMERVFATIGRFPFTTPQPIYLMQQGGGTGPMTFNFKFDNHELTRRESGIPARRHLALAGRISANRASRFRPIPG